MENSEVMESNTMSPSTQLVVATTSILDEEEGSSRLAGLNTGSKSGSRTMRCTVENATVRIGDEK